MKLDTSATLADRENLGSVLFLEPQRVGNKLACSELAAAPERIAQSNGGPFWRRARVTSQSRAHRKSVVSNYSLDRTRRDQVPSPGAGERAGQFER